MLLYTGVDQEHESVGAAQGRYRDRDFYHAGGVFPDEYDRMDRDECVWHCGNRHRGGTAAGAAQGTGRTGTEEFLFHTGLF